MPSSFDIPDLESLLESARLLHASLDLDDLLRHLLRTVMGRLVSARGLVAVSDGGILRVSLARGCRGIVAGDPFDEQRAREAGLSHFVRIGDALPPLGVLGLSASRGALTAAEAAFLDALCGLAASGIANARNHGEVRRLNWRLDVKVQELRTLLELARALSSAEGPEEVAHLLGLSLAGQWAASRWAVLAARPGHAPVVRQKGTSLAWDEAWPREIEGLDEAVRLEGARGGAWLDRLRQERLALLFPLRSATGPFGLAAVGPRPGGRDYTEADCEFGAGVVAQAVVAFDNAWHQRDVVERKQIERELALAASIQQNLFPAALPAITGYGLAAMNRPARLVGGDYYDALAVSAARPGGRYVFCVADVSGKGVAASLLMSNIQATLRALLGTEASLAGLAHRINDLLYSSTPGNKYATAVLLATDPDTGDSHYVSAGHAEAVVIARCGAVRRFGATGLALGLFPGASYDEQRFVVEPGDVVALYSDGISEAQNGAGEEYGAERLIESLRRHAPSGASQILQGAIADLDAFVGGAPQHDDITLLVVKRDNR